MTTTIQLLADQYRRERADKLKTSIQTMPAGWERYNESYRLLRLKYCCNHEEVFDLLDDELVQKHSGCTSILDGYGIAEVQKLWADFFNEAPDELLIAFVDCRHELVGYQMKQLCREELMRRFDRQFKCECYSGMRLQILTKVFMGFNVTNHPATEMNKIGQSSIHRLASDMVNIVLDSANEADACRNILKYFGGAF